MATLTAPTDVGFGRLPLDLPATPPKVEGFQCNICFEQTFLEFSCPCKARVCRECLVTYFNSKVTDTYGFCVPVPCPCCLGYVKLATWEAFVPAELMEKVANNANSLLTVRCCGNMSLLPASAPDGVRLQGSAVLYAAVKARSGFAAAREFRRRCQEFTAGGAPGPVLEALEAALGPLHRQYDLEDFGLDADRGLTYLRAAVQLVQDTERRAALYVAYLRRHPIVTVPCCFSEICFACQLWHEAEVPCESFVADNYDVKHCPECRSAYIRSEGCSHILCPCGADLCYDCEQLRERCRCNDPTEVTPAPVPVEEAAPAAPVQEAAPVEEAATATPFVPLPREPETPEQLAAAFADFPFH